MTKEEFVKQEYNKLLNKVYKRTQNTNMKETVIQSATKVVENYFSSIKQQEENIKNTQIKSAEELFEAVKWFSYNMSDNHHDSYYAVAVATAFSMSSQERKEYSILSPKELYQKEKTQNAQDEYER
jgi:hypothetical protein